jgi:hypothetical protein
LGLQLSCDRQQIIKDAKSSCKRYIGYIKGKIQTTKGELLKLMIAAYYRSLMVYYFTPLIASGLMSDTEVDKFEATLTRS